MCYRSPRRQRRGSIEASRVPSSPRTHRSHRGGNVAAPLKRVLEIAYARGGLPSPRRQRRGSIEAHDVMRTLSATLASPRRQRRGSIEAQGLRPMDVALACRHRGGNVAAPLKRNRCPWPHRVFAMSPRRQCRGPIVAHNARRMRWNWVMVTAAATSRLH